MVHLGEYSSGRISRRISRRLSRRAECEVEPDEDARDLEGREVYHRCARRLVRLRTRRHTSLQPRASLLNATATHR